MKRIIDWLTERITSNDVISQIIILCLFVCVAAWSWYIVLRDDEVLINIGDQSQQLSTDEI